MTDREVGMAAEGSRDERGGEISGIVIVAIAVGVA